MRAFVCACGVILAIPTLVLGALGLEASYSPSGWIMLVGILLVAVGAIAEPWPRHQQWFRAVAETGVGLVALIIVGRLVFSGRGDTRMKTLPGTGSRWL